MSYGLQALKLIVGLLTLILTLRVLGKLSFSQLTPYDVVYLIVFGGILDSTFFDDEIGIAPFLFSVFIWSVSIYMIEFLARKNAKFRWLFRGSSDPIMENGKLNMTSFKKNNLEMELLRSSIRKHGIFSLKEVKDIYLETDGSFSINKYAAYQPVVNSTLNLKPNEVSPNLLLVDTGKIESEVVESIGKSDEWVVKELKRIGITDLSDVIYCEWSQEEGFYIKTKTDVITKKDLFGVN